jgi:hypothetical protein
MRHRLLMSRKPTTFAFERFANEMNWCDAVRYLFARNSPGSTTSTQSRNSNACHTELAQDWACVSQLRYQHSIALIA